MTDRAPPTSPRYLRGSPHPPLIADPIVASAVFLVLVSGFFRALPGVDIWFSGLFYDPASGFPLSRLGAFTGLRTASDWLLKLAVVLLILPLLMKLARPSKPMAIAPSKILFLLSTLLLGPGLIVNFMLKDGWGRPRPRMVGLFGGDLPFVPVWQMSDYCSSNCSFASGEASTAVWLIALALVVPSGWRKTVAVTTTVIAVLVSLNRIAFGGHFLSDVLVAWGLMLFVIALLHRLIIERPPPWLGDAALEAPWTALGQKLHRAVGAWNRRERGPGPRR